MSATVIGLERGKVAIVPYSKKWPELYLQERDQIFKVLSGAKLAAAIQHVGSTAVKGMMAKPIIDIAVGLTNWNEVVTARAVLARNGYHYLPVANVPGLTLMAKGRPVRTHHLHVVVVSSFAWNRLLLLRDYLRKSGIERSRYQKTKVNLAKKHANDRKGYATEKAPTVNFMVHKAAVTWRRERVRAAVRRTRRRDTTRNRDHLRPAYFFPTIEALLRHAPSPHAAGEVAPPAMAKTVNPGKVAGTKIMPANKAVSPPKTAVAPAKIKRRKNVARSPKRKKSAGGRPFGIPRLSARRGKTAGRP